MWLEKTTLMHTLEQRIQGVAALGAMLTDYFLHGEKAPIYLDLEETLQIGRTVFLH